jgi:hypothetical protein
MKKALLAAVAVGVMTLASGASAQDDEKMWLSTQDGKQMIMGGDTAEGSELLVGTGAKPADCPAGHYYTTDASQQMVMKCDDDSMFSLSDPESGATMSSGEPYPEGSKILTPSS